MWMILPKRIERREFFQQSREEGVVVVDRLFRPLVLKKALFKAGEKEPKQTLKKERIKTKHRQSTETVKEQFFRREASFFQRLATERKKLLLLRKCSLRLLHNLLFFNRRRRRRRRQRERSQRFFSRLRGVFCARERERERLDFLSLL